MAAIETREDLVSGTWTRAEAEALAEAADVGVRAAARRGALLRPLTSEHAVSLLRAAIAKAGPKRASRRTTPVSLAWTRPEAAALAARAREGVGLGEEFGLVDDPALALRALTALEAFIEDSELVPAPRPMPPRRPKAARRADRPGAGAKAHDRERRSRA